MSIQERARYGTVVICDLCEEVGALFDRDWRVMRRDTAGEPVHLCRKCHKVAVWCAAHQAYHRPSDNHRRACSACGGLFTSEVRQGIEHCPSCRRALQPAPAPAPARPAHPLRALFLRVGLLH